MFKVNPYRPGAGLTPDYLAGRDEIIDGVTDIFDALNYGMPVQSIIFSGLRGVGKTVLLNKLRNIANEKDIYCAYIEVEERKDFILQVAACCQKYLREYSTPEKLKIFARSTMDAIKSLVVTYDPQGKKISVSAQEKEMYMSYSLVKPFIDVFTNIGELAIKTKKPICFFIDEIQYMEKDELGTLITAIHRSNQLGYPIMIVGAGLPRVYKMLSDERSYSERLFNYEQIDNLDKKHSREAICKPADKFGYVYTEEAIEKITEITGGYPYFIQQFCSIIYDSMDTKQIGIYDVERNINKYYETLDKGFFKTRLERCSQKEKLFVFAMVDCDELPCTISNVAKNMHKEVKGISPIRAQLINKGIIYPVRYKELDFTVPEFDKFIRRLSEYQAYRDERA